MIDGRKPKTKNLEQRESEARTAGKSLRRIFHQDETLKRIIPQTAYESHLMNRARMDIFIHVLRYPGDHLRSISRKTGVNLNSVRLHLSRLESAGYIESAKAFGRSGFYFGGYALHLDAYTAVLLRHDWPINLLRILGSGGRAISQREIAFKMKASQQLTSVRLKMLESSGLVSRHGTDKKSVYFLSDDLKSKFLHCQKSSRETAQNILAILKKDGLMPSDARIKDTKLSVTVILPGAARRLHIECNPLSELKSIFPG